MELLLAEEDNLHEETICQGEGGGGRKFSKSGLRRGVKHLGLEQLSQPQSGTKQA